ncbi:hypothetical protein N9Y71_05900 [Luminiphilus sp.]|nr:hypothetical protein [Luminiphilus sp.]
MYFGQKASLFVLLCCGLSFGAQASDTSNTNVSSIESETITLRSSEEYGVLTRKRLGDTVTDLFSIATPTLAQHVSKSPKSDTNETHDSLSSNVSAASLCPSANYRGYFWLPNQNYVDSFVESYPECTEIDYLVIGKLVPGFPDSFYVPAIISLQGLSNITAVNELLVLETSLETLEGLDNLKSVAGYIQVVGNDELTSIANLDGLDSIGSLVISQNEALVELPDYSDKAINLDAFSIRGSSSLNDCSRVATLVGFPDKLPFEAIRYAWRFAENGDGCNSVTEILNSVDPDYVSNLGYQEPIYCDQNVSLGSQAEIDAFRETYGDECNAVDLLSLSGSDITNLNGLVGMRYIGELNESNTSLSDTTGLEGVWVLGQLKGLSFSAMPSLIKTGVRYGFGLGGYSRTGFLANILYDAEKFPELKVVHAPLAVTEASSLGASTLTEVCDLSVTESNAKDLSFLSNLGAIECPFSIEPEFTINGNTELTEATLPSAVYNGTASFDISFENNAALTTIEFLAHDGTGKSSFGLEIIENAALATVTLPDGLVSLSMLNQPSIYDVPDLPSSLKTLSLAETKVSALPALPETLETLNLNSNEIQALPALPQTLSNLNLTNTQITAIPELPSSLGTLTLSGNPNMTELSFNSDQRSLSALTVSETPITSFSGTDGIIAIRSVTLGNGAEISEADFANTAITYELSLSGDVKFRGFDFQENAYGYEHALGTLNLSVSEDADLSGLSRLTTVRFLNIIGSELANMDALENLVGASAVNISSNTVLIDTSALADIEHTNSWTSNNPPVVVERNPLLRDVELGRFYATLVENMESFSGVQSYGYAVAKIRFNDALEKLSVFQQATAAPKIWIEQNSALRDLDALRNISKAASLIVRNNASLSDCGGAWLMLGFPNFPHNSEQDNVSSTLSITNNAEGAMNPDDCLEPLTAPDADPDNDGVPNEQDAFPSDPAASVDSDGDAYPDQWNEDATDEQIAQSALTLDAFPESQFEWLDTDGDGIGNNADTDDDGDGILDIEDAFSLDPSEWLDTDGDGIGNNADTNDDGDAFLDISDAFPLDPSEWWDTDGDGIGNNADTDDDNDGLSDSEEINLGTNQLLRDTDGDGYSDEYEVASGTDPLDLESAPDDEASGLPIWLLYEASKANQS